MQPVRARPRTPGLVYTSLALVITVLLALFALTATQPPPPTIAEFAPQAVEQITESPQDGFERGAGQSTLEGGEIDPLTGLPRAVLTSTVDVARVRNCVGDP